MEDDAPVIYGLEFQVLLLHCPIIHYYLPVCKWKLALLYLYY